MKKELLISLLCVGLCADVTPVTGTPTQTGTISPTFTPTPTPTPTSTQTPTTTYSHTPTGTPHANLKLCAGLNLVSKPLRNDTIATADEILANICGGQADVMWEFNCVTQKFTPHTVLDPGTGWLVDTGMPFWVNITNKAGCIWIATGALDSTISFNLCTGLNMVSLPIYSLSINLASHMLADVPDCNAVFRWKKTLNCLNPQEFDAFFHLSTPGEDFTLIRGYGYYVSCTSEGSWTPPDP